MTYIFPNIIPSLTQVENLYLVRGEAIGEYTKPEERNTRGLFRCEGPDMTLASEDRDRIKLGLFFTGLLVLLSSRLLDRGTVGLFRGVPNLLGTGREPSMRDRCPKSKRW